jgi:hypothetical protein
MNVNLLNKRKSGRRALVLNAAKFYVQLLKLESSRYDLIILDDSGLDIPIEESGATTVDGNTIYVYIDHSLGVYSLLAALAHEMVHAKQFATGLLAHKIVGGKEVALWRGKRYDKVPYLRKPWEILAFQRQELMVRTLEACFTA